MTLRTIENQFSEELLAQMKDEFPLDLTLSGPMMKEWHPKVLWTKLQYQNNPERDPDKVQLSGFSYHCFQNFTAAEKNYPEINFKFSGKPWALKKFLEGAEESAIIDFHPFGAVMLTRKNEIFPCGRELHDSLLPVWLDYALSSELWGPLGKWERFHERLMKVCNAHNLLDTEASLGYYPLKSMGEKLEGHGFMGTRLEKSYLLVLPWTFSLTALTKLEEVILQEF
ncbi:MAG: hypothetical protein ACLGHN_02890 [Bacteriovoracia bacterium]